MPEAIQEFQLAEKLDPAQPDVHYTMGVTLWQQGESDAAVVQLRAAVKSKPDYAEAYYTLGTVLKQQGKLRDAADSLREAIRLQPDFAGTHTTLAAVLRQLGDTVGAASEAREGTDLAKQKSNLQAALFATNSGKRLLNVGDLEGAISQFRSAIQSVPDYAPAHFQLGLALQRHGDSAEAANEFQQAAKLDPRLTQPPQ